MLCLFALGALLSLNRPAEVDRQEDAAGSSLASACCQSGLPRTLFSHNQGHQGQETSSTRREGQAWEDGEEPQAQRGKVRATITIPIGTNWLNQRCFNVICQRIVTWNLRGKHIGAIQAAETSPSNVEIWLR